MTRHPILYVHSSASSYGSDNALHDLLAHMDLQRFPALVVVPEVGPLIPRLEKLGVRVIRMPLAIIHRRISPLFWLAFLWHLIYSSRRLCRLIRSEDISLIHSNTSHVLNGAMTGVMCGIPHIWQVREIKLWSSFLAPPLRWLMTVATTRVVCVSEAVRAALEASPALAPRVRVLLDGIDVRRFNRTAPTAYLHAQLDFPAEAPLIGLVGRIVPWKGHAAFVAAAARIHAHHPQIRFVIVGEALTVADQKFAAALKRDITRLGLTGIVGFAGHHDNISQVMSELDVLAMLSELPEAWGLVVLEAMATETAVVATRHGGPLESMVDGETGLLVEVGDHEQLARAFCTLIDSSDTRHAMGAAGKERVDRLFRVETTSENFMALYREVLHES